MLHNIFVKGGFVGFFIGPWVGPIRDSWFISTYRGWPPFSISYYLLDILPPPLFAFKSARLPYFNSPAYFTEAVTFKNPHFNRIHGPHTKYGGAGKNQDFF